MKKRVRVSERMRVHTAAGHGGVGSEKRWSRRIKCINCIAHTPSFGKNSIFYVVIDCWCCWCCCCCRFFLALDCERNYISSSTRNRANVTQIESELERHRVNSTSRVQNNNKRLHSYCHCILYKYKKHRKFDLVSCFFSFIRSFVCAPCLFFLTQNIAIIWAC